ncbi:hypothetical protein [Magnetofaba australis]|uniref:Uncharacterized protein n=1 Tax=Magnetofaba australis IT-1 TaxID=1434232 RepID=A0A1Y2KAA1_9PROT|nr:hypothetical protein [Magnetofaba australis]OSM07648.1 hypothetical protein MAIT1_04591 [Magnetofaba australis IT-1]
MALYFNDNIRNNMLNTLRNYISGWCYVYSGTKPPNSDYPAPPTYLVRFQMQFSNASGGKMSLSNAPVAGEVVSTGTATWFRIDNGSYKLDGSITTEGGGGDAILDNVNLTAGEMVTLKKMDFSIPNPA